MRLLAWPAAAFAVLSLVVSNTAHAESVLKYATPDGGILTLNQVGSDLAGSLSNVAKGTDFIVEGSSSFDGTFELKLIDDASNLVGEATYKLARTSFSDGSQDTTYAVWQKVEGSDAIDLPEFSGVIRSVNPIVSPHLSTGFSVKVSDIVDRISAAQDYFAKLGIKYEVDADQVFNELSAGGETIVVKLPRTDIPNLIAKGWAQAGELSDAAGAAGVAFQTTGQDEAVASLSRDAWRNLWAPIAPGSVGSDSIGAISSNDIYVSPVRTAGRDVRDRNSRLLLARASHPTFGKIASSPDKVAMALQPISAMMEGRCDIWVEGGKVQVVCDHHTSRYGLEGQAWMRTRLDFLGAMSLFSGLLEINIIPSSVVANGFKKSEYGSVTDSRYLQNSGYEHYWAFQDGFLDEIETFLVREVKLSRR